MAGPPRMRDVSLPQPYFLLVEGPACGSPKTLSTPGCSARFRFVNALKRHKKSSRRASKLNMPTWEAWPWFTARVLLHCWGSSCAFIQGGWTRTFV